MSRDEHGEAEWRRVELAAVVVLVLLRTAVGAAPLVVAWMIWW